MIPELRNAAREICQRLRRRPYQRGVTITAWHAVIEQLLDGRRFGAFAWSKAVEQDVRGYIAELKDETKMKIWESTDDAEILKAASLQTITECLYPHVYKVVMPAILRAVRRKENQRCQVN